MSFVNDLERYVRENRERFPRETLRASLIEEGVAAAEVDAAMARAYGDPPGWKARWGLCGLGLPAALWLAFHAVLGAFIAVHMLTGLSQRPAEKLAASALLAVVVLLSARELRSAFEAAIRWRCGALPAKGAGSSLARLFLAALLATIAVWRLGAWGGGLFFMGPQTPPELSVHGFRPGHIEAISAPKTGSLAAARLFYNLFRPARDPRLPYPDWLEAEIPRLARGGFWKEGSVAYSEAELWQAPAKALYDFLVLARRSFDGEEPKPPEELLPEYEAVLERFGEAYARLGRATGPDALGGRGPRLLEAFAVAGDAMRVCVRALKSGDLDAHAQAAYDAGEAARYALLRLDRPPR